MAYNINQGGIKCKACLKQIFGENLNKEYKLTGPQVIIGRSPRCQIKISSLNISRRHCVLTGTKTGWLVKDFKSQNGTYINGRQLRPNEEYLLQCGDIIFLGPPSELPQAFSYDELMENDSDDDVLELPQKRACDENSEISSKKTALNITFSSNCETNLQSSPNAEAIISNSPIKIVPSKPKKRRYQKKINPTSITLKNPTDNENISNSAANIAGSSKTENNLVEMNIHNVEQFYEISSTNNNELDNSESLLHTDSHNYQDDNLEMLKNKIAEEAAKEKAEKEKELELKLALLSEELKTLQASKSELLKNYKDVCEKNKVLDKELDDKQKKMEKELEMHEVKAKNELKSELLEKFEEDLVCNICTELFIKPTVLDCSHTFCEFCIKEWRKKKNDCPICRCKIKNTTQVRTLEQFIDKTLATLTPDQKLKRANVIAERNLAERPPVPSDPRVTPRRRRGSHRHHNRRHHRVNSNIRNDSIQVLHESGRTDYSHRIYHLASGGSENPLNIVDLATMGAGTISVIFG